VITIFPEAGLVISKSLVGSIVSSHVNRDTVLRNIPLTLDDHDPRVIAADAAEQELYEFYGISYTARHIMLPQHGIRVRITETGEGAPVVIVPGNTGDGFPFIPLLPRLPGRRIITINRGRLRVVGVKQPLGRLAGSGNGHRILLLITGTRGMWTARLYGSISAVSWTVVRMRQRRLTFRLRCTTHLKAPYPTRRDHARLARGRRAPRDPSRRACCRAAAFHHRCATERDLGFR
jgi:hypothetical protein